MIDTRRPSRCRGKRPLLLGPSLGLASARPLQAAFKSAKVNFAYLANSYLVNNHYYEKLINNYTESVQRLTNGESSSEYGLDSNWLKIMKIDNWYGIYPVIGYQRTDISDIEYKEIDRTHQFTRTFDKMKAYGSK